MMFENHMNKILSSVYITINTQKYINNFDIIFGFILNFLLKPVYIFKPVYFYQF